MFLEKGKTGLWIVDVQEKLFSLVDHSEEVLEKMCILLEGALILNLPVIITEQYPQGLGKTIEPILRKLPKTQKIYAKTTFSGYSDPNIKKAADDLEVSSWILMGIESHICVLQTAKDLARSQKGVVVANDAVSSRSVYDLATSLEEFRASKIRVSSVETLLYELVGDAKASEFKQILSLVKGNA